MRGLGTGGRRFRRAGQFTGLLAQQFGNFRNPRGTAFGREGQTAQMPPQGFGLAPQLAVPQDQRDHGPQQRQGRQDTDHQPPGLVGQQGVEIAPGHTGADVIDGQIEPHNAQQRADDGRHVIDQGGTNGPRVVGQDISEIVGNGLGGNDGGFDGGLLARVRRIGTLNDDVGGFGRRRRTPGAFCAVRGGA